MQNKWNVDEIEALKTGKIFLQKNPTDIHLMKMVTWSTYYNSIFTEKIAQTEWCRWGDLFSLSSLNLENTCAVLFFKDLKDFTVFNNNIESAKILFSNYMNHRA